MRIRISGPKSALHMIVIKDADFISAYRFYYLKNAIRAYEDWTNFTWLKHHVALVSDYVILAEFKNTPKSPGREVKSEKETILIP